MLPSFQIAATPGGESSVRKRQHFTNFWINILFVFSINRQQLCFVATDEFFQGYPLCCAELEKSNQIAVSLEENMRQAERERQELEEARLRAEEARRFAEEAANLEKEERDRKVCMIHSF